jgi:small subunit ribosomal protein S4
MKSIKEKKERSLGTKLFLKAERCNSAKCVMVRRPYRPGPHGQKRKRAGSDFSKQLQEKQRIRFMYGLTNRQMMNLFKIKEKEKIMNMLEHRLDRVVFLMGIAGSPRIARQFVSHGHITVNGRKVTIPSFHVKVGDVISVRSESRKSKLFEELSQHLKKHTPPSWLKITSVEDAKGQCVKEFSSRDAQFPFDVNLVGEFFAR